MFISKKEKKFMQYQIAVLNDLVNELTAQVRQLQGWEPLVKGEKSSPSSNLYKWAKEHPTPKKRGRPVGSKNKEK